MRSQGSAFAAMDSMMDPISMPDPFGRSGRGLGLGNDGIFRQMDDLMASVMAGGDVPNGGSYSSKTMMYSAKRGADGNMQTERFTSSTVGVPQRSIRETQQAYSNSEKGIDKMALERQLGDQGRKVVKERSRRSGEERDTHMFRGMTEEHAPRFDERWQTDAAPYLPSHNMRESRQLQSGGYVSQSLKDGGPRDRGFPSRASDISSTASSYAPSELSIGMQRGHGGGCRGNDKGSHVNGAGGARRNCARPSSDSSQVGALLRHDDVGHYNSSHRR